VGKKPGEFLFSGRGGHSCSMTTQQYARFGLSGLQRSASTRTFSTRTLRRTKATFIYRRAGNLRAVQPLWGHLKIESMISYLAIEVKDALGIAEQLDV